MWQTITNFAAKGCGEEYGFFGIPPWHKYLSGSIENGACNIKFSGLNDIWLVVVALLEILLRLSAFIAVAYIIWGSIILITSNGSPQRIGQGRNTILFAIIGLVLAVSATVIVNLIASQF